MSFSIDSSPKRNADKDMNLGLLSEIIYTKYMLVSEISLYKLPISFNYQYTIPEDYNVECQLLTGTCLTRQCELLFVQSILAPVSSESHHSRHLVRHPGKSNCKYISGKKTYFINSIDKLTSIIVNSEK